MSSLSLIASPLDEPEIHDGTQALSVAANILEDIMGQMFHQIRLKELDEHRIPSAIDFSA